MSRSIFFQVVARLWLVFAVMAVGPPASAQISRAITDEVHPHGGANDLNGDGNFDISDMVHGLRFLFGGGLPPSALDLSRAPTVRSLEVRVRDLEQQILQLQANPGCRAGRTPHVGLESHFYKPIDLNRAVQEQFGPAATLTTVGEHLYDWRANVNGQLEHLDLALAVARHYGTDWTLVSIGPHRNDWKAVRLSEPNSMVLPVMLVASDRFFDIAGVREGLNRFESVLEAVQGWYNTRVDGVLRVLDPVIVPTSMTSAQWNAISASTAQAAQRFDLFDTGVDAYRQHLADPGPNLKVVLVPYTGDSANVSLGAAAFGRFALAPQRASSLTCSSSVSPSNACADAIYAVGHELGHTFGLQHSCDVYPNHPDCSDSLMQTGRPPNAILLQREIGELLQSPFFHPLGVTIP